MDQLQNGCKISTRRACEALRAGRSIYDCKSCKDDQAYLRKHIKDLASIRAGYDYKHIGALLKRESWKINHKRVRIGGIKCLPVMNSPKSPAHKLPIKKEDM